MIKSVSAYANDVSISVLLPKNKKETVKNKEYIICMCGAATVAAAAAAASHIRIPKTCYNIFWKQTTFSLRSRLLL